MSEPGQNRLVTGLAPRRPVTGDLSVLRKKNRTVATPEPSSSTESAPLPETAEKQVDAAPSTKRITVYIDKDVFTRARGVYRATSHLEDDKSWSQFVEKALAREVEARERAHNAGNQYGTSDAQLSAGRPLSS